MMQWWEQPVPLWSAPVSMVCFLFGWKVGRHLGQLFGTWLARRGRDGQHTA